MTTIRKAILGGAEEDEIPILKWAEEVGIPLEAQCNYVTDAILQSGPPNDPDLARCRPLCTYTGPYFERVDERGSIQIDVWCVVDDEEEGAILFNGEFKLGWICSRNTFDKILPEYDARTLEGYMINRLISPKHAILPNNLGIESPDMPGEKGLCD